MVLVVLAMLAASLAAQAHASGYIPAGPANLTLSSFYVPRTIGQGAPLVISGVIGNSGGLATGNITVEVALAGSNGKIIYSYAAAPLSPMQNESIVISANSPLPVGSYAATITASSYGTAPAQESYSVNVLNSGIASEPQPQNAHPSMFLFKHLPIYMSVTNGSESVFNIGITNTNSSTETIALSIPSNFSQIATLSSTSEYLPPGSTVYVQMMVKGIATGNATAYSIPLGVDVYNGPALRGTSAYAMRLVVIGKTAAPMVLQTIALDNSSTLSGTVQVTGMGNAASATLVTQLPRSDGTSGIHTSGLPASVTSSGDYYYIYWSLPSMNGSQSVYAYYTTSYNSTALPYTTQFTALAQPSPNEEIRIINFSLPTFYTDSRGSIAVEALYTGTKPDSLDFYVSAPPGVTVVNSTQVINATPNQLVTKRFALETGGAAGTVILELYVTSSSANITYSLPVIVLQKGQLQGASPGNTGGTAYGAFTLGSLVPYLPYAAAAILIGILIYATILISGKPRYNSKRAKKLMAIKEELRKNQ